MRELNSTAHKILDIAEHYTQTNGFNAFSYKDIQREVGIKTSSIHYYFPTKQDLAICMTERYIERFEETLLDIAQQHSKGTKRLKALGDFYASAVSNGKFCMCGMLASDMFALPNNINALLLNFFGTAESLIEEAIQLGKDQGKLRKNIDVRSGSSLFLAVLEGAMLVALVKKDPEHLKNAVYELISQLK